MSEVLYSDPDRSDPHTPYSAKYQPTRKECLNLKAHVSGKGISKDFSPIPIRIIEESSRDPPAWLVGMYTGVVTMENSMDIP